MNFPIFLLLLISDYSIVIRKDTLYGLSVFLNLLKLNLQPSMWFILDNVPSTVKKRVYTIGYLEIYCVVQIFYLLILFCIVVLCIESGVSKCSAITESCLFFPSVFFQFLSHIFWLLLDIQTFITYILHLYCTFSEYKMYFLFSLIFLMWSLFCLTFSMLSFRHYFMNIFSVLCRPVFNLFVSLDLSLLEKAEVGSYLGKFCLLFSFHQSLPFYWRIWSIYI